MTLSTHKPERLLTFSSGGWVLLLSAILCVGAALLVLWPAFQTGFQRAIGDGKNVDTYGFDLSNLLIPREKLEASGVAKDQIRAIPPSLIETVTPDEVKLIRANEHINFLVPSDKIIGVEINGETHAYPVRVLNLHEVANDVLGGVPIVVTWSPLSGSAVVFDRRIDGQTVEFGVSGLLLDSNLVIFDRRSDTTKESLWPQLRLAAISGPAAGKKLKTVPYAFTTWDKWTAAHPATKALQGLRTLKKEYGGEPFNTYLANDQLKFKVDPLWPDGRQTTTLRKTPIVASSPDGQHWTTREDTLNTPLTQPATMPTTIEIHTFTFAWYAQHKTDTDYTNLK